MAPNRLRRDRGGNALPEAKSSTSGIGDKREGVFSLGLKAARDTRTRRALRPPPWRRRGREIRVCVYPGT